MKMTNIVLAVLLVLQGVILLVNPSSRPRFTIQTVKMYDIKPADIAEITVADGKGKRTVTLYKDGARWKIRQAFGYEADKSKIDEILAVVSKLQHAKEISTNKTMFGSYNLGDDNVELTLGLKDAKGKVLADILVGKAVIRGNFLRKKGGDTVYSIPASIAGSLFTSATEYMADTTLKLPMGKERVTIALTYLAQTVKLKKTTEGGPTMGPDGQMSMKEDVWSFMNDQDQPEPTADATEIKNLVGSLDNLMFDAVEAAKEDPSFGFSAPHVSITLSDGKKKSKTLIVGAEVKGRKGFRYLKVTGSDFIYGIDGFKFEKWHKTRKDFLKEEPKKPEFGADGKLPVMDLPKADLNLKVPGIVDPKKAKDTVVYPAKPKPVVPTPAPK